MTDECIEELCIRWRTYSCNCSWSYDDSCCPPPPECDPCDGKCNPDSDGDGIANVCDPCPNDPNNNCGGGCKNDSDCPPGATCEGGACKGGSAATCDENNPCPEGYECIGGSCNVLCQQTGSGDTCDPDAPNNGCPSGERCCWGVGFCYAACCGGGGGSPDLTKPQCGVEIEPKVTGGNLVVNGDFETGDLTGWTDEGGNPISLGIQEKDSKNKWVKGNYSLWSDTDYKIRQDISVKKGKLYQLVIWGRAEAYLQGPREEWGWGMANFYLDPYPKPSSSIDETLIVSGRDTGGWKKFEMTAYARDRTMSLLLWGRGTGTSWYEKVGFDFISLKEIEGADNVPSRDVDIKIGVWDNRHIDGKKIQKANGSWPLSWTSFSYEESAEKISTKLPEFGGLGVLVRDKAGNMGLCADGTPPTVGNPPDCTSLSIPSLINQGEAVTLTAKAKDTDGSVDRVRFYYTPYPQSDYCAASWTHIGTDRDGSDGWSKSWDTTGIAEGEYLVVANVYDDQDYWCTGNLDICEADKPCSDCRQVVTIQIVRDAWFQTEGGDVHAQTNISDLIPDTCEPDPVCEPYCSLLGDGGSPGVVSYGTSYDFKPGSGRGKDRVSEEGWLANSSYGGPAYGYDYFDSLIEDDDGDPVLSAGKPLPGIYKISGDQSITSNWGIGSTQSYVFLIEGGKLTINNNISVAVGGFLAFIVDGNIEISESVTSLEGIFIADGEIETSGQNDTPLSAEGMFISWNRVPLDRLFVDESLNNTLPVETFVFRPDIWINAPQELLKSSYTWQELAP